MSYYSGQGNIYVAEKDVTTGDPTGFTHIGNVPNLEVSIETTKFEHKESMSGSRAVDVTIVQEKKGTFTMTLEDMDLENLALGFWGETSLVAAGTAVSVDQAAEQVKVNATVAEGETLLPFINHTTGQAYVGITTATWTVTGVGATPDFSADIGESEGDVNSKCGWLDLKTGDLHIFDTETQTANTATVNIPDATLLEVTIDHGAVADMSGFTKSSQQRWIRFSGLNTIDDTPVVIDLFKADLDPLTGYGLINEELGSFEITGSLLYDDSRSGTSKFFSQTEIGA